MYHFKLKQRFRNLSILALVPYIILCITAGGFHSLDENAYHGHNSTNSFHSENADSNDDRNVNDTPIFCDKDHSEDNCIICKWLKHTQKRIQLALNAQSFIPVTSRLCVNNQHAYYFLNNGRYLSRGPPLIIS